MVNLHEAECDGDVNGLRRVTNWSDALVIASEQIAKQSFFVVERRRLRRSTQQLHVVCMVVCFRVQRTCIISIYLLAVCNETGH